MDTLLRIAFQRKNKTLRSQLTSSFAADGFAPSEMDESDRKAAILAVLQATNLHDARAVKLTCDQFHSYNIPPLDMQWLILS